MTSSRPTKVSRAAHEQPQRRGHETFSPTSHKSFYGTEAETSKHFPTQNREQERARQDPPPQQQHQMRTASRPDSFVPKAPPLPPSPPPVAGPSRLPAVVKQRTGVNRKSIQKTREPVTIVLSSSDEGEETPEREEQPMPNAQRPSIAANQGDRQSATTAPRYQNSLTANNLQYYGSPRDADSSKRKRPSHSSSVTPQVNGPDEIEDFEDGHDDTVIHLPRPPPKSNVTKRARMQDKNGNSSVSPWHESIVLKPIVSHACTLGDRPISEEEGSRLARPCGRIRGRWTEPWRSNRWRGLIFGTARNQAL